METFYLKSKGKKNETRKWKQEKKEKIHTEPF